MQGGQQSYKVCPDCGLQAQLDAQECLQCKRVYNTQAPQPPPQLLPQRPQYQQPQQYTWLWIGSAVISACALILFFFALNFWNDYNREPASSSSRMNVDSESPVEQNPPVQSDNFDTQSYRYTPRGQLILESRVDFRPTWSRMNGALRLAGKWYPAGTWEHLYFCEMPDNMGSPYDYSEAVIGGQEYLGPEAFD